MDWFLDRGDARAAGELRRQIGGYLRRHCADQTRVDDAELVVEELLGNGIRHSAGPVWVSLDWSAINPVVRIYDLGEDFELDTHLPPDELAEGGRGLFLAAHLTRDLRKAARASGGNVVTATLMVERPAEESYAPVRHSVGVLPDLTEADGHGAFGKESFLRALVVQLAHAVEEAHGPTAAEEAVAQVGTDVGGQMETAYRLAEGLSDKLTAEQMADCYVRLKHAIDGGFYVVEADERRIVLGNRACPFGPVVQRSPSLCRMTSSVFGGIAARNAGGATVTLAERIAVGDPQCRVVVDLGPQATDAKAGPGHRYAAAAREGTVRPDTRTSGPLAALAEQLSRRTRELERFAGELSHDLRGPLAAVHAGIAMLDEYFAEHLPDKALELLDGTLRQTQRMQQMIEDLLAYSRIEGRGGPLTSVDSAALVRQLAELHASAHIDGDAHISVGALPRVVADEAALRIVFHNLLGNAVKFAARRARPVVQVSAAVGPAEWVFRVADNGPGIAPADRERVFGMLQRGEDAADVPGVGMGLAMCARIIERHSGRMWVEDSPLGGAAVCFSLPDRPPDS